MLQLYLRTNKLKLLLIQPLSRKAFLPFHTGKKKIVQVLEFSVIKQGIFMYYIPF